MMKLNESAEAVNHLIIFLIKTPQEIIVILLDGASALSHHLTSSNHDVSSGTDLTDLLLRLIDY